MNAFHCTVCKVNWPASVVKPAGRLMVPTYRCPMCGMVVGATGVKPLTVSQANHVLFDKFAADWDAKRFAEQERAIRELAEAA